MNYRKPFFVLLAGVLLLSAAPGRSQTFENPSIQGSSSFAVITDSRTARECRPQMTAYKQTLEAEGLPVYIVSHDWTTPEQVRDVLRKLYAENALEGCVFIGDVPIAMITKAQHLTSAFKMDERDHPLHETSVPSDRFYDDFDLQFVPQGTPSQGLFHYYEMSPDSPQYISCDIYSGRIKAQKAYGDPYKQIARYLEKAVAEHRDATPFDQFVSYTGHGSYSNSLIAWRDEQQLLDEQFGDVFSRTHNAKFLRYSMQPFVKESLIREVRRDDVDMMVFHEHGMPHRQYLSGTPYVESAEDAAAEMQRSLRELARRPGSGRESAAKRAAEKGLDSTWYNRAEEPEMLRLDSIADLRTGIILEEVEAIAPNARFVVFDACYNGDYREDDFIAGHYIMAPGRCVTTFANSVNVLQDKSAFDLLGLLGEGLRIGAWAKNIHILESHVIGDPTYRFKAAHPELDINSMALKRNNGFWLGQLDNAIPDIQNLAMIRLWENDYPQLPAILLDKCSESPYSVVRYNAFRLLESLNGPEYKQALMLAAYDRFEFLRRIAVTRMGRIGDEAFISVLIDVYVSFAEGLVIKIVPLFLNAPLDQQGMGLTEQQIGLYYGTFGVIAFVVGSILGGYFISWLKLRRALFPLVCIFNVPFVVYALLAWFQPSSPVLICAAIVFEYFSYGFGFVGLTLFIMQQVAPGSHQMAHYAFGSSLANLGVMLPGMISGWLCDSLGGYHYFFMWALLATVPAFLLAARIPFTYPDTEEVTAEEVDKELINE